MKKLLLVGKLNKTLQATSDELVKGFAVQVTTDSPDMIRAMMKIHNPDIVVVLLNAVEDENAGIFEEILFRKYICPLIAVGTADRYEAFSESLRSDKVKFLEMPVDNSMIYAACRSMFRADENVPDEGSEDDAGKSARRTILLVDDSAMMLRTVKRLLDDRYNVYVATSGAQAMVAIGRNKPDLVILDYDMPVCDGKMTLEMIRADEGMKDLPVVFLTGKQSKENIMSVIDLKPAGYLIKPTTKDLLLGTIEKIIGT